MSLSASEFYEAGLALPPSVRKDVALRLLESIEVADQESVDEAWTVEIGSRVDDILSGPAARAEFNADTDWYDEREFGMGDRFEGDVLGAVDDAQTRLALGQSGLAGTVTQWSVPKALAGSRIASSTSWTTTSCGSQRLLTRSGDRATGASE